METFVTRQVSVRLALRPFRCDTEIRSSFSPSYGSVYATEPRDHSVLCFLMSYYRKKSAYVSPPLE